jgi:hydroxyacylglutathione hydrolase
VLLNALSAFDDNYIWCLSDDARRTVVVDPGDAGPVLDAAASGCEPVAILLTHHHHDHIGGVAALLERWPALPVVAPDDERIVLATQRVGDGDAIAVGAARFDVLAVPGHTATHVAFVGEGAVFCGDTLFSLGCGRLFEGTPAQMWSSLSRLARLDRDTRVCCGHEYTLANAAFALAVESDNAALRQRTDEARELRGRGQPTLPGTIANELDCNPFLRCEIPSVRNAVELRLGRPIADAVEIFAELRRWKDGFRA